VFVSVLERQGTRAGWLAGWLAGYRAARGLFVVGTHSVVVGSLRQLGAVEVVASHLLLWLLLLLLLHLLLLL
jgi:hypothetical protein